METQTRNGFIFLAAIILSVALVIIYSPEVIIGKF